ncbi:MAG: molybdopterin-binding protein [Pigmentiphaga sp.]|nr:molybdopterin-binding protein [Pigmentiphaga sp.]
MSATPANRRFGLIIVGDEILSGRRQDQHFAKVVQMLAARGLSLSWCWIVGDDFDDLVATYRRSLASGDIVFSCGGIGATPDDRTRQAMAAALDAPVVLHPQARELITEHAAAMAAAGRGTADMNSAENERRLQMGEFPAGAEIVANPYNRIPGFWIRDHTFTPGFPVMAWPMIEQVLDSRYVALHHGRPHAEHSVVVFRLSESQVIPAMQTIETRWPSVRSFSLPSVGTGGKPSIELGVKGEPVAAAEAFAYLRDEVMRLGGSYSA